MNAGFELFLWNLGRGMWHLKLWVSMKMEKGLWLQRSQEGPHAGEGSCWNCNCCLVGKHPLFLLKG